MSDDVVAVLGELGLEEESSSSDFLVLLLLLLLRLLLLLLLLLVRFGFLGDGIISGDNDPSAFNHAFERLGDIIPPSTVVLVVFFDLEEDDLVLDLLATAACCLPSNTRLVSGVKVRVGILGAAYLLVLLHHDDG